MLSAGAHNVRELPLQKVKSAMLAPHQASMTLKHDFQFSTLQEWLQGMGRSEADAAAVITGFKEALGKRQMPELGFGDFARGYPWLLRTLSFMQQARPHPKQALRKGWPGIWQGDTTSKLCPFHLPATLLTAALQPLAVLMSLAGEPRCCVTPALHADVLLTHAGMISS